MQSDVEVSLRDAHSTIVELERQMATLRKETELEEAHATKETQDLHKQLDEMKDRNTALEQQMMEYSTTVQDQAKVGFIINFVSVHPQIHLWQIYSTQVNVHYTIVNGIQIRCKKLTTCVYRERVTTFTRKECIEITYIIYVPYGG